MKKVYIAILAISSCGLSAMDEDIMSIKVQLEPKEILKENLRDFAYGCFLPIAEKLGGKKIHPINIIMSIETALYNYKTALYNYKKDWNNSIEGARELAIFIILRNHPTLREHFNTKLSHKNFNAQYYLISSSALTEPYWEQASQSYGSYCQHQVPVNALAVDPLEEASNNLLIKMEPKKYLKEKLHGSHYSFLSIAEELGDKEASVEEIVVSIGKAIDNYKIYREPSTDQIKQAQDLAIETIFPNNPYLRSLFNEALSDETTVSVNTASTIVLR